MKLIDGKACAQKVRQRVAEQVAQWPQQQRPTLAVVLVGDDPASQVYVRNKGRATERAGMGSITRRFDQSVTEEDLLNYIDTLANDTAVHGILVQLPLPEHINAQRVIGAIPPEKDVDGFQPLHMGQLWLGQPGMIPCTPLGCLMLLKQVHQDMSGLQAVIVGRSAIVGKPMAALLLQQNCTVTIAHSRSKDIAALCSQADVLVAAVGRAHFIQGHWLKPGATVIDVGINRLPDGKLTGDVDYAAASEKVGAITPVPGGVGPMTIACLLVNTLIAASQQQQIQPLTWQQFIPEQ